MRFVVVMGLSGAGKSQAMKSFEDLGFYCLDNLPPALVLELVALAERARLDRVALSIDTRVHGAFGDAIVALDALAERGLGGDILFLDASEAALVRRYGETRRRHPREDAGGLRDAIAAERVALEPIRARAAHDWDTSSFTQTTLKQRIAQTFDGAAGDARLTVNVVAFGFKYGVPIDAELVFDVRFLANPNYVPELRELTGLDSAVAAYMAAQDDVAPFLERVFSLIDFLVPRYAREARARLTIAIGCTGGRHRSVYVAARLVDHLARFPEVAVARTCRELALA